MKQQSRIRNVQQTSRRVRPCWVGPIWRGPISSPWTLRWGPIASIRWRPIASIRCSISSIATPIATAAAGLVSTAILAITSVASSFLSVAVNRGGAPRATSIPDDIAKKVEVTITKLPPIEHVYNFFLLIPLQAPLFAIEKKAEFHSYVPVLDYNHEQWVNLMFCSSSWGVGILSAQHRACQLNQIFFFAHGLIKGKRNDYKGTKSFLYLSL